VGLLLDRWVPGWQRRVARGEAPGAILRRSLGASTRDIAALGRPYGYAALSQDEDQREERRRATLARYRAVFFDGPRLVIPADGANRSFDPNTLVPLDTLGTVYPTGSFTAPWGTLEVDGGNGALLAADYRTITLAAPSAPPPNGTSIRGDGWSLTLVDGWVVRALAGGRAGDLEVTRK
jgi:hypothetical protein